MIELPSDTYFAYGLRVKTLFAAGHLTRTERDVLLKLAELVLHGHMPTASLLAGETSCSIRTVRRALAKAKAKEMELLLVAPQFEAGRQIANRYTLRTPTGPIYPRVRGGCQKRTPSEARKKERRPTTPELELSAFPRPQFTLAEIAQRRAAQLAGAVR